MTARGNGRSPVWAILVGVLLLAGAAADDARGGAAAREDGPAFRWAVGYADGVVLRRDLGGGWTLDLSGGPNDDRRESDRQRWITGGDGTTWGPYPEDNLRTREAGWVRLGAGRRLTGDRRTGLDLVAAVRYRWSRGKQERTWVSTSDEAIENLYAHQRRDVDEWRITVGLRQSFRLTERLSCETGLGITFSDRQEDIVEVRENRDADGVLQDRHETRTDLHTRDFFDFGWSGTASLAFLVWF